MYPCTSIKYFNKNISGMVSSTLIRSPSVNLLSLIFCLVEKLVTTPLSNDTTSPVRPFQSSYTVYGICTHHLAMGISTILKVSFNPCVPLRYFNMRLSIPQSSSSSFFRHVMRNATSVWMSLRARELMNIKCHCIMECLRLLLHQV